MSKITIPSEVFAFLRDHRYFAVLGHKEPDGDCVSSQLALAGALRRMGRTADVYSDGPFSRPELAPFAARFRDQLDSGVQYDAAVILDCSTPERTGQLGEQIRGLPTLVLDHHSAGEPFGDLAVVLPEVPACALIVQNLIEQLGLPLAADEAKVLLFGLCTDTGFFRHLPAGAGEVFRAAGRLADAGASPHVIYHQIYGERELSRRLMLGEMLKRTEQHFDGRLLFTFQSLADRNGDPGARGDDELYTLLQTVKGSDVLVFVREESGGECSVGLRSDNLDVGEVARHFGGGGHRAAAGCLVRGTIEQTKQAVLDYLAGELNGRRANS